MSRAGIVVIDNSKKHAHRYYVVKLSEDPNDEEAWKDYLITCRDLQHYSIVAHVILVRATIDLMLLHQDYNPASNEPARLEKRIKAFMPPHFEVTALGTWQSVDGHVFNNKGMAGEFKQVAVFIGNLDKRDIDLDN